jgi:O-acetylserine/cysteine efflux transporter
MTALGYFLWNSLLLRQEVGRVAPFLLLLPVFSVIGGILFLDEAITLPRLIGGAIVLSGVALITIAWPTAPKAQPDQPITGDQTGT